MNYKKEKFQVAGVSHYADDIMEKIAYENDDYSLSARDLADIYDVGDRIFEYSFDDCNASLVPNLLMNTTQTLFASKLAVS